MGGLNLAPCFVTGCPKSGTTLAVQLLNNHPDFMLDHEVQVAVGLAYYHDMMPKRSWARTAQTDVYINRVYERLFPTGRFDEIVGRAFGELHSGWDTGKRWGSGSKALILYRDSILQMFPQASFLLVMRDPRDVFCSLRTTEWRQRWATNVDAFITHYNSFLPHLDRVPHIRYEEIIHDPTSIYRRLDLQVPENYLNGVGEVYGNRSQPKDQPVLVNGDIPDVLFNRVGRWKRDLDVQTAALIVEGCSEVFHRGFYLPS